MRLPVSLGVALLLVAAGSTSPPARAAEQTAEQASGDEALTTTNEALRVYLDCSYCPQDFIRTEIGFVDFVRDPTDAEVHILVTGQTTGSGGVEHQITITGQRGFQGLTDSLKYVAQKAESEDTSRRGLTQFLRMGLVRYVAQTPLASQISVSFGGDKTPRRRVRDRWRQWVFTVRGEGSLHGEQQQSSRSLSAAVSADRVTPDWKLSVGANTSNSRSRFETDEGEVVSTQEWREVRGLAVRSLSSHWSTGGWANVSRSTYLNRALNAFVGPAVEFDVFPYTQSTNRLLTLQYRIGLSHVRYIEPTIFDKLQETLLGERLLVSLDRRDRWGSLRGTLEGSHYFHDFSKNGLAISGSVSLRVVQGLSWDLHANASRTRNQLSLPKREATTDEILLRQRQLATSYNYGLWVGLSYTFGSIYNSVVNPRFGK